MTEQYVICKAVEDRLIQGDKNISRRSLLGSLLAYQTYSSGSYPKSDIKTKSDKKNFFGDFLSADFWKKLSRVNKPAMKNFLKNLSFGVDVNAEGAATQV